MESSANPNQQQRSSLYPEINFSNPETPLRHPNPTSSSSSNLYPSLEMHDLVGNLFPGAPEGDPTRYHAVATAPPLVTEDDPTRFHAVASAPPLATEEVILRIPGAILHLIDQSHSVELACGDFTVLRLVQGENVIAVLARVAGDTQWPLTKDEAAVKVDDSHYFFSLRTAKVSGSDSSDDEVPSKTLKSKLGEDNGVLNYGLTIASKGQNPLLLHQLDKILSDYSCFSVQKVSEKVEEVLDVTAAKETSPAELKGKRKEMVEKQCAAYWTTLAPNVEDYSGKTAKLIAAGSGQLIKGILWCGDVTMERLKWGNEIMTRRMTKAEKEKEISPETLRRIKRVKRMTKMTEKVANGVLSGVVKVSGSITGSVANSKAGKKFFSLLPGEIILATLDGFNKICDAVEVAGKNVMKTSSTVTTEVVDHRYGAKAAQATNEGLDAAGHAMGTAWAAFKIRQAINPKSVLKPSTLAKTAAKAAAAEEKKKLKKGTSK